MTQPRIDLVIRKYRETENEEYPPRRNSASIGAHHAITARLLCAIKCGVSLLQNCLARVQIELRYAKTGCNSNFTSAMLKCVVVDGLSVLFRERLGAIHRRHRCENRKLLAAIPAYHIFRSAPRIQKMCDMTQHLISKPVTVPIVDRFEFIDVRYDQRKRIAMPARRRNLGFQSLVQICPVP